MVRQPAVTWVACECSLLRLMTRFWNQFTADQTAELSMILLSMMLAILTLTRTYDVCVAIIGSYLLTFLGNKCTQIPQFVLKSATQVRNFACENTLTEDDTCSVVFIAYQCQYLGSICFCNVF